MPRTSGMAVTSMVLGILGVVTGWMCIGFPFSILAIVFGHVAFSKIARRPQALTGRGMAIAGFTMGYVGLVIAAMTALMLGAQQAALVEVMKEFEQMNKAFQMPLPPR